MLLHVAAGRGASRPVQTLVGVTGFLLAAVVVFVALGQVWPTQHDLSDISTGLMQLIGATVAGVVGAVAAVTWVRNRSYRDRRSPSL